MSSNLADLLLDLLADLNTPVLISSGQDEFKFCRSTPRSASRPNALVLTSSGQDVFKFGKSTPASAGRSMPLVLTSLTSTGQE